MQFAHTPSWWLGLLLAAAVAVLTVLQYRRPAAALTPAPRGVLIACRVLVLTTLVLLLFRPIVYVEPRARDARIPVLVDVSRSMRMQDAGDGETRLSRAVA